MDTDRKYVLMVANSVGLGHLLTAVLNSAYYAYRTGRVLALDMRDNLYSTGDKHAAFFEYFSLEFPPDLEVITDLDEIDRLRRDEDLHFLKLETDRLDVNKPFAARVLLIPCLVPGEPYPISAKQKDLPFRVGLRGKLLEAWQSVMQRPEWSGPVIGLHYRGTVGEVTERMTKFITPDYEERYRAVKDRYIATALKVAQEAGYDNPAFLVASDDAEFVNYVTPRLPNAFNLASRLPDQEIAAWIRSQGHDFGILSETVNDLWCLSACDHFVHFRSSFSHFAMLNSGKLDQTNTHYVHVPNLKEIMASLDPEEAVTWARGSVRQANIRRLALDYLWHWLADALDRAGQTEAAARERQRAQWIWETHHAPVTDNADRPQVLARAMRGDLGGVLDVARRAVVEHPDNPYWLNGYGGSLSNVLAQMGRWEEAIPPAQQAVEMVPEDPFLHEHLGFVLTGAGALLQGEQAVRQAIAIDDTIARFYSALGGALTRQGRSAEAVEALREAVRLEPGDPLLLRRLGTTLVATGDYAAAEAAFRQALAMRSEAGPHIDLYDCFVRQGREEDAIVEAKAAAALEPTNPHWHYRVALSLMHVGRLAEAEPAARAAVEHGSEVSSVFQNLLAQILQLQGRTDESIATVQEAADLAPEDPQRQLLLGRALFGNQQFGLAEAAARRAAELQPDLVSAHDLLSEVMERQNRMGDAVAPAQRAAELMPQDYGRFHRLGLILFRAGDMARAEQALRRAERLNAGQPTFHNHHVLGIVLERQGRLDEAIVEARKASDLEPANPDLLSRLAAMLLTANRLDEAETSARKAVSLRPDAEQLQRLLASITERQRAEADRQAPAPADAMPAEALVVGSAEQAEALVVEPAEPAEALVVEPAEQAMPEPATVDAPPVEELVREPELAMRVPERTLPQPARPPRRQWLSGNPLSWPLRQMFTGRPKSGA